MSNTKHNKITVAIASTKNIEEKKDFIDMVVTTAGVPVDIIFVGENKTGLTTVYQDILDNSENDIIVYIHDDIEFLKRGWGETVLSLFSKNPQYGIIGVAGACLYGADNKFAWWTCDNKEKRGIVFHGDSNNSFLTLFSDYNLKSDISEVVVIDGLFMAVNRDKIEYNFDEDLKGFHFYDIDFCLANFLSHRCKIGVTDRIAIRHKSVGNLSEEWVKDSTFIKDKYKDNFPIRIFKK